MDFPQLIHEASNIQNSNFIETVEKATFLLSEAHGHVGKLHINERLVTLEPSGEALVVGDLHGDLESLTVILKQSRFLEKMANAHDAVLIFLGDYGDRGSKSVEVYYTVLRLKLAFPEQVVMLRGNHEAPKDLLGSPHDLPAQFRSRFGADWQVAYQKTRTLWSYLYNAVYVSDRYLMVHGGVSPEIKSLQDIAKAQENQNEAVLEDLLWSDPDEDVQGVALSPRGAGKLFGKSVTEEVLGRLGAKVLVRGHEPVGVGFKLNHDGKVLTLFSRKGSPYFNRYGVYLQVPLSEKPENAQPNSQIYT